MLTLSEVCNSLNINMSSIKNNHVLDFPITGFAVDSRHVKQGNIFIALKGTKTNGELYLQEAKKNGAIAAIVSSDCKECIDDFPLLKVEDSLQTLQYLAKHKLEKLGIRIIAITGSVGKTTTKEFTQQLLSKKYRVAFSPGNQNSQIGMPLTILNQVTDEDQLLILEMGMTEKGHLSQLVQIAPPEVGVITQVALVHACNFESIEEIALTKAEIFSNPSMKLAIFPREIPEYKQISEKIPCKKSTFSLCSSEADYKISLDCDNCIEISFENENIKLGCPSLIGKHNLHNLLASIVIARYFKLDWNTILDALSSLSLPEKRLQYISLKGLNFLNDSYNAAEVSVKAALEVMAEQKVNGRKIAVLGSMMELGKFSHECHSRVGECALNCVDEVYCLGIECDPIYRLWKKEKRPTHLFKTRSDLVGFLKNHLTPNDLVLLKGSSSNELWKVLEEL